VESGFPSESASKKKLEQIHVSMKHETALAQSCQRSFPPANHRPEDDSRRSIVASHDGLLDAKGFAGDSTIRFKADTDQPLLVNLD
jgi:hypothetical protein